ncbi:MAG: 2-amino-4-hydroxy-6-hydroxymethyldihydropteridine diphosphokinase [Chloroflexota bacterium]|nr:MAG: 2-amino-4-hydroxy-6-hydroxymethyldihydropteridine diphosphokinase [Chloroflexota bacterium]
MANLEAAVRALPPLVLPRLCSPVYQTAPWGFTDQPDFLNQVIQAETGLSPADLLAYIKRLEEELGRQPNFRYGPRLIDLDILFYDDLILASPGLAIPHAHLHERAFVLVPLADIAPNLVHPLLAKSVSELLIDIDSSGVQPYKDGPNKACEQI